MSEPFKEVVNIDRVVHEPARLAILLILEVCVDADFKYLQTLTGLSKSNLSIHLSKLETHGLIAIDKMFVRKTPRTVAKLTKEGKAALREYRRRLEEPKRTADKWTLLRRRMLPEPSGG
jgi:DNA-binding transcriptional ArsR family regulator